MPVRRGTALALAVLLCALALTGLAPARAEPADAVLAPITVKPWLRPATPVPAETPVPVATSAPAETSVPGASPPSSLSMLEEEPLPTAQPTPLPTAQPALLPGVLGLADATRFRLLLIGTDAYRPDDAGRSDTMVLLQVQPATGEIRLVSFLRDLYVAVPGHGHTRLNAAYVYGGASLLLRTLRQNFGVTADRTLAVNFSRMAELIDRIGGVTVEVSEKERRQLNSILKYYNVQVGDPRGDELLEASGTQMLTGKQALCYSRIRKIDSDFARTGRQRKVLEAIFARVRTLDALSLADLLRETLGSVSTDLTLTDAVALVPVLLRLQNAQFTEMTVPVRGGYHNETLQGMAVLVPDLDRCTAEIAAFLQQRAVVRRRLQRGLTPLYPGETAFSAA